MTLGFAMSGVIANAFRRVGVSNFASAGITSILFAAGLRLDRLPAVVPSGRGRGSLFGFLGACPSSTCR